MTTQIKPRKLDVLHHNYSDWSSGVNSGHHTSHTLLVKKLVKNNEKLKKKMKKNIDKIIITKKINEGKTIFNEKNNNLYWT